jgi:hypothetical protein
MLLDYDTFSLKERKAAGSDTPSNAFVTGFSKGATNPYVGASYTSKDNFL